MHSRGREERNEVLHVAVRSEAAEDPNAVEAVLSRHRRCASAERVTPRCSDVIAIARENRCVRNEARRGERRRRLYRQHRRIRSPLLLSKVCHHGRGEEPPFMLVATKRGAAAAVDCHWRTHRRASDRQNHGPEGTGIPLLLLLLRSFIRKEKRDHDCR
nr:uncharacterized protein LOC114924492 [Arachis hypogaea]